jgi:hypothetical protein
MAVKADVHTVEVRLSNGTSTLIDAEDLHLTEGHRWHEVKPGGKTTYANAFIGPKKGGRWVYLHRLIMGEPDCDVDHRNGNGLDNRRSNLRLATRGQNIANRPGWARSGYRGVEQHAPARWRARGAIGGKSCHLGTFGSPEEAARAYDRWARGHHGEFAWLNFPEDVA